MIKHFGENMSKFEESLNFNDIPLAGIISVINRSNHMYLSSMLKNSEITFVSSNIFIVRAAFLLLSLQK